MTSRETTNCYPYPANCYPYSLVGVNASKVAVESIMVSNKDFYLTLKKKGFEQDIRGLLPFGTIRHCIYSL